MNDQVLKKEIIIDGEKYFSTVEKIGCDCGGYKAQVKYEVKIYKGYDIVSNEPNLIYLGRPIIVSRSDNKDYIEAVKVAAKEVYERYHKKDSIEEFEYWDGNCDV